MLPTNVVSFMKKMVATEEGAPTAAADNQAAGTFGKLRQTLSSSLLTAQDRVTKMSPRPSLVPDVEAETPSTTTSPVPAPTPPPPKTDPRDPTKPPSRAGACRVCLKSFKPDDFSKTCKECQQRVCEDCASYSKPDENQDPDDWRCSVCRRKLASRAAAAVPQGSTDSLLEVPMAETLARRHSDVKLGVATPGGGLAPPRSPELRRHSDVSPASLKELEKLKGSSQAMKGSTADLGWNRGGRSGANSRASSPPRGAPSGAPTIQLGAGSRRGSRVPQRQRSYDDELNPNATGNVAGEALGLPAPMPRRASAYDVFAPGLVTGSVPGAPPAGASPSRRASCRITPDDEPCSPDRPPTLQVDDDRRMRRRGSQLPDITALMNRGALPASKALVAGPAAGTDSPCPSSPPLPTRQQSVDGEAIRIVIHDVDGAGAARRRVILRRDPADKGHRRLCSADSSSDEEDESTLNNEQEVIIRVPSRHDLQTLSGHDREQTRGFGMRVVGGKVGPDGRLFAYIVWTVPGGPAEKGGLQQGDKVLEWGGVPLTDRSFEEVCSIMDRTGDMVELLVEHAADLRICDLLEEPRRADPPQPPSGLAIESTETDKSPSSPTRRKLPKTPEQIARAKQVTGRVQLQVWYHGERRELVVALMAADELAPRDDFLGYGSLPEAYAQLRLLPIQENNEIMQTSIAPASQSPIWNANLTFSGISGAELAGRNLQVTLWDLCPQSEPVFMGECTVDLEKAFLDDCAVWYRLEDPRGLRGCGAGGKSPALSPRGSLSGATPGPRRGDFAGQRSVSDDVDSIGECTSLLHPDHAWVAGSRRGSSQSETLEVEVYQLGKDFSRSLPGSRRSSFQQQQERENMGSGELEVPAPVYRPERRRSSVARHRDPDEILRNLKQVRGELGRTMSFTGKQSRRSSNVKGEYVSNMGDESPPELGPGQVAPKGRMPIRHAQIKLALHMTKGQLELEVICGKNITTDDDLAPDSYVKCYLRDGERWFLKKKTKVIKHNSDPQYNQTLKYQASEVFGRSLIVMIWQKARALEHNVALGGCEIALEKPPPKPSNPAWYPLFPVQQKATDSSDSP